MRERDRTTYTVIWVAVTAVAALILVVVGSPWFALALVGVALVGLVAFLRATHPRGAGKPNINIFFDDLGIAPPNATPRAFRREIARRAFKPAVAACRIVPGELSGTAGVYGAAKVFLDARANA